MDELTPTTARIDLPTPDAPPPKNLFVGAQGLRPFWALLLYLAIVLTPVLLLLLATHLAHVPSRPENASHEMLPFPTLIGEWLQFGFIVFATWIMSRIESRRVSDYGLARVPRRWRLLVTGVVLGVLFQSLLIFILWTTHHIVFQGFLLRPAVAVGAGLVWAAAMLGVAFCEEFLFRGYLQFNLTRCFAGLVRYVSPNTEHAEAVGFWIAAVLISFGFGLVHGTNPGESPIGLLCAGAAGLMFAFSLWRTGSLWWAIGLHMGWDWAQSFLFGVADSGGVSAYRLLSTHPRGSTWVSGGATGPEGSIFVLPVMVLIVVVAAATLPRNRISFAPVSPQTAPELAAEVNSPEA